MDIRVTPGVDLQTLQRMHTTAIQACAASDYRLGLKFFRDCLKLQQNPIIHMGAGEAATHLKRYPDAEFHFREALKLAPDLSDAHFNLGNLYHDQAEHSTDHDTAMSFMQRAQSEFEIAIALKPSGEGFNNLANILRYQLKLEEAEVAYENAFSLGFAPAQMNLALLKLLRLDYQEGWRLFESRTQYGDESAYGPARQILKSLEAM